MMMIDENRFPRDRDKVFIYLKEIFSTFIFNLFTQTIFLFKVNKQITPILNKIKS